MEEQQLRESTSSSVPGLEHLTQIGEEIRALLEQDLVEEAVARFLRLRGPDQAHLVTQLTREGQGKLLPQLTPESVGEILEELEPEEAVKLSQALEPKRLSRVLDMISPDVAADVLRGLPEEMATQTLREMTKAKDVSPLLAYEDDDAGGLMTPDFIALNDRMTVAQALAFIRRSSQNMDPEDLHYLFVVDRDAVLMGRLNLSQLVLAQPHQQISLFMDPEVISVSTETDQEECARLMERYHLPNLPVIDENGKMVGVIHVEVIIDVVEDEVTEDMYRMIGVGEQEQILGPFWTSIRGRLPWLVVNLGTVMFAGFVVSLFESTLARMIALVAFLPVIAGQGGIAGTQTLTVLVRSLALGEVGPGNTKQLLIKEAGLGLAHGLALGVLVGIITFIWKGNEYLSLVLAIAMILNLVVAGISGVLIPLIFKALRIDPALSSAVAVTTLTDVLGLLFYLGLATLTVELITRGI